jgi:hypothetical protein
METSYGICILERKKTTIVKGMASKLKINFGCAKMWQNERLQQNKND